MEALYLRSDSTIVYGEAKAYVAGVLTTISTGTCTARVKDADGNTIGSSFALTYNSTLKDWRGEFEDPYVDLGTANGDYLVEGACYTIEITFAGSGDFAGVDDFRTLPAMGVVRGNN